MNIRTDQRTGIKYADFTIGGKRRRVSLRTKDKKVAILRAAKMADDTQAERAGKITLEAFLTKYRAFMQATRKKGTIEHFERALRKFLAFNPVKFLDEITPAVLDAWAIAEKSKIKKDNAAGLNRNVRALKTAMRQAEFWELMPPQNWRKVSKFKESKGRVEFHTPEEIRQILSIFDADWKLVVLLGCRAGLRRGEIAALKWQDVDFAKNQLYVAPNKTDNFRYIPIAADLKNALKAAKKRAKIDYVVEVGKERKSKYFLTAFYSKETKEKITFHCFLHKLRHTFASHLVQAGVDLYRVSKLLGHKSIKMTEIYAHLCPPDFKQAIMRLPKL